MSDTLTDWLSSLPPERLAELLVNRPEVWHDPLPGDLATLAERLSARHAVRETLHWLPTPAVEVVQVLQLLGAGADRASLARWLGRATDDHDLADTLQLLEQHALVWPDGDRIQMVAPLYEAFLFPLGLGAPAQRLLQRCTTEQLRQLARTLRLPAGGRKAELTAVIGDLLRDPDRVRALVGTAPPACRDRLMTLAIHGPDREPLQGWYAYQPPDPVLSWATARGLVLADQTGILAPPIEVALALRGPGWHAPFQPQRPLPPLITVPAATVEHETAAAATVAVEALGSLLATVEEAPVGLLKAGGVGTRELGRLARASGLEPAAVRLWLEVAYEAGLVAAQPDRAGNGELLPTAGYDGWLNHEPAAQLATVLPAWQQLAAAPLLPTGQPGRPAPALIRDYDGQLATVVRRMLLELLGSLPPEQAITDRAGLADAVGWQAPLIAGMERLAALVDSIWQEATLTAVLAHGRLSPLGRALLADGDNPADQDTLVTACRALLPAPTTEAVFQADLTALAPGAPARALATLLDAAADRESAGGAVTWRFSADSVRRALDTGWQAEPLLAALREHATGGKLPQPLAYLVTDVARRHGAIRVRTAGCVLRADDPALIAELAGARSLRKLGLASLAPTVLSCAVPLEQALAALRAAGYAPVAEDANGVPQLGRVERRRAGTRPRRGRPEPAAPAPEEVDPRQYAKELLAAPIPASPGPEPVVRHPLWLVPAAADAGEFLDNAGTAPTDAAAALVLESAAGQLSVDQRRWLAGALAEQLPVRISYTSRTGERSNRIIEPAELDGAHLIAWCRLRDDERRFALARIESVSPVALD